jgi:hypothetical protein
LAKRRRRGQGPKGTSVKRVAMAVPDNTPPLPGLGAAFQQVGESLGVIEKGGLVINYEPAPCSCGGENPNCFKCDGTGVYRREVVLGYPNGVPPAPLVRRTGGGARSESTFSNDPRGDQRGIREQGRFESNPHYDGDV